MTLTQPVPDGTSFEAVVTLPNGDKITATVDDQGHFTMPVDGIKEGDELTVEVIAHNGDNEKASDPIIVTVDKAAVTNPIEDYDVATPTLNPEKAGETAVSGTVELGDFPEGTTFEAIMVMPNGRTRIVRLDSSNAAADGTFIIQTDALTAGQVVQVKIIATNGTFTKESATAEMTVAAANPTNPLENYNVAEPVVDPVKAGDKAVRGSVTFTKPIPEGTNFTAVVTLPNGIQVRVPVDENGQFAARVDGLKAGDRIIVQILAENDGYQKASVPVDILVSASDLGNPGGNGNNNGNGNGTGNNGNGTGDGTGIGNNGSGLGNGQSGSSNGQLGSHGPGTLKPLSISSKALNQANNRQSTNGQHLPQTGEKSTSVWSWLGMLVLTAALFIKRLVPIKRDK
ncbi:LPXTG cell wall anchor domain-containing protein [Latilactobacillus curvatus]|uniref:LPXTG cell wall anchor domain-containing protein n=1 Tax=Latilactobacillus curvatus TaxID=28038 RepID=UPI000B5F5DAF|nr:LPXTG cell wall anchor domain-containing protein [Latilactobacillus curvatus]ASN62461.1 hypothetical protein CGZ47_07855 [Latilactobacillus curvatus]MCT2880264.1 LPXTG cell wall anchor domain-containing protein [Latilactobacillus curvatus]